MALYGHVPASLGLESKGKVGGKGEGAMAHRFRGSIWVGIDRREVPTAGRSSGGRMSDGEQVPAKKMRGGREGVARP